MPDIETNAFIVLQFGDQDDWVFGRIVAKGFVGKRGPWVVSVISGPKQQTDICEVPPWHIVHVHNQPEEADDSPAWRATRQLIAQIMARAKRKIA